MVSEVVELFFSTPTNGIFDQNMALGWSLDLILAQELVFIRETEMGSWWHWDYCSLVSADWLVTMGGGGCFVLQGLESVCCTPCGRAVGEPEFLESRIL